MSELKIAMHKGSAGLAPGRMNVLKLSSQLFVHM